MEFVLEDTGGGVLKGVPPDKRVHGRRCRKRQQVQEMSESLSAVGLTMIICVMLTSAAGSLIGLVRDSTACTRK